jgi:hypothetical protein
MEMEPCIDRTILRDNNGQGVPIAVIYRESRDRLTDRMLDDAGTLRLAERMFICNSTIVPTSLVSPL